MIIKNSDLMWLLATLRFTGIRQNQLLHLRMWDINLEGIILNWS
ncbi:hypothetical protein [Xenorhabdus griffiniae]|uniref:Integrase n=1 Tax=Xenorhabdus griffiniae TaxID=351672 RepID=A0ABY9XF76_9GAMM|nr:hypothetical protein [Xenorhabdus griffiniae]WMV71539.1 hypothetical protein QL128_15485 [Xenorhabdus griffiniae]WNH01216.1 hypothetical protein QL112_015490 [Xenorhabdus griffiniae]